MGKVPLAIAVSKVGQVSADGKLYKVDLNQSIEELGKNHNCPVQDRERGSTRKELSHEREGSSLPEKLFCWKVT